MRWLFFLVGFAAGVITTPVCAQTKSENVLITYYYPGIWCNKVYSSDGKVWAVGGDPANVNQAGLLAGVTQAVITKIHVNLYSPLAILPYPVPVADTIPCYGGQNSPVGEYPNLIAIVPYELTD